MEASYCNGTSATCPNTRPKEDNITPCNEGTQVCYKGECMRSICEHRDIGLEECQITYSSSKSLTKAQRSKQCQIHCKSTHENCKQLESIQKSLTKNSSSILSSLNNFTMTPGARCNEGRGFCDPLDRCRDIDPEGTLQRFTKLLFNQETAMSIKKFVTEKWYFILVSGIGFIAVMGGFIKCFSLHTPSSNPRLPQAYAVGDTLRRTRQMVTNPDIGGTLRRTRRVVAHPQRAVRRLVSFRDEPPSAPPAYDDIFTTNTASNPQGIEMNNARGNRQSRMETNRSSRQSEMVTGNRASVQAGMNENIRASRQPRSDVSYRSSRQPQMNVSKRESRQNVSYR